MTKENDGLNVADEIWKQVVQRKGARGVFGSVYIEI